MNKKFIASIVSSAAIGATLLPLFASAAVPTITSVSPSVVLTGSSATTVNVNGNNFAPDSVIRFNGSSLSTTYVSENQLRAVIPASNLATSLNHEIRVFNPSPGGGTSNANLFTVMSSSTSPNPTPQVPGLPNTGMGPESTSRLGLLLGGMLALFSIISLMTAKHILFKD